MTRGVQNPEHFGKRSPRRFIPRPAGHFFRNKIEKGDISGNVRANDGVTDGIEGDLGALLFDEQRLFHRRCAQRHSAVPAVVRARQLRL